MAAFFDNVAPMTHEDALASMIRAAGNQRKLAAVIGVSEEHISRWGKGKYPIPDWVLAMAELIEQIPPRDWPERWKR